MRLRLSALPVVGLLTALLSLGSPADAAEKLHTVYKGQTLGRIAKRYNVSVDALRDVNGLKRGQMIRPGLVLVIPEKGKEAEAAKRAAALRGAKSADQTKKAEKKGKEKEKGAKGADSVKGKARGEAKEGGGKVEKLTGKPKRPGFVKIVRGTERLETQLLTRHGRLVPSALPHLSRMLRFAPTGAKIPVDPRLATLLGLVSDHFGGKTIHVVSGFRPYSPTQYTRHSKHNVGHAIDFRVEGVPNTVLRDYCRTFRNAGVGYYPNSTFVHLDVRTAKTYWVDYSRPGDPPRYASQYRPQQPQHPHVSAEEEAASDVSPGEANPGDESKDTQEAPPQAIETTTGIQRTQDPASANAE
ncbi:MAG: DUF882 domain-containing protein [Polyangiaceae bacterium]|nr:DUF882 domain-containing protein [Polyangiaceae bacterium]